MFSLFSSVFLVAKMLTKLVTREDDNKVGSTDLSEENILIFHRSQKNKKRTKTKTFFTCKVVSGGREDGGKKISKIFAIFADPLTFAPSAYVGGYHKRPQRKNRKNSPSPSLSLSTASDLGWFRRKSSAFFFHRLVASMVSNVVDEDVDVDVDEDDDQKSNRSVGGTFTLGHGTTPTHPPPPARKKTNADIIFFILVIRKEGGRGSSTKGENANHQRDEFPV